jgi:hypothetical protein
VAEEVIGPMAQQVIDHYKDLAAAWKPITEAPHEGDVIVCDARTKVVAVSSYEDQPYRRGWRHRNGFPATHFLAGVPPLPEPDPDYAPYQDQFSKPTD